MKAGMDAELVPVDTGEEEETEEKKEITITLEDVFGEEGFLAQKLDNYEMRKSQIRLAVGIMESFKNETNLAGEGPTGCHVAGQKILMFDGSLKAVENIVVGDRVMGPDSLPREVLSLVSGEDDIFEVVPVKGDSWRVNKGHILSLQRTDTRGKVEKRRSDYLGGEIVDVSVEEWMEWSNTKKHIYKLFRTGVSFDCVGDNDCLIDPYLLGLLLGDGMISAGSAGIITMDNEIVEFVYEMAQHYGLRVRVSSNGSAANSYYFSDDIGSKNNILLNQLEKYSLRGRTFHTKFIPDEYKISSIDCRLRILAGLMDTDGSLTHANTYDFISASLRLSEDVAFIARSVGLAAYVKKSIKSCDDVEGVYWRVSISGDVSKIPCRVERKKASIRKQKKSVLRTGFNVFDCGYRDKYYGFVLDGDHRYLLSDFTVTHNCGKSLAYLVPAILMSDKKRTVVVTANIALQEQLVKKDLPFLQSIIPVDFEFALLKGRNNYLCREAHETTLQDMGTERLRFFDPKGEQEQKLLRWAEITETGDRSDLPFEPEERYWKLFSATTEECIGKKCNHYNACFGRIARQHVATADIVVCNYHVLYSHVSVVAETGGRGGLLGTFHNLVLDEAHKTASIARSFFGWDASKARFNRLIKKLTDVGVIYNTQGGDDVASRVERDIVIGMEELFHFVSQQHGKKEGAQVIEKGKLELGGLVDSVMEMSRVLERFSTTIDGQDEKESEKLLNYSKQARDLSDDLSELDDPKEDLNSVFYSERFGSSGSFRLCKRKIDVSRDLGAFFNTVGSVIATSATLAVDGSCGYIRNEIGLFEANEMVLPSPFNYKEQAAFIVSRRAPDPQKEGYTEKVCKALSHIIKESQGRALCLFTSRRGMLAAKEYLEENTEHGCRILCQGDMPRMALIEEFKTDIHSVLLGTESFWAGVDVPGESLSCVVVDKIPFRSPGDPVWAALCKREGRNWFGNLAIPDAVIQLKQGIGRLIRTADDCGVAIVLDRRLKTKGYGHTFIDSMPDMEVFDTLGAIKKWLKTK